MNVILTENVPTLGEIGQIVKVAPGYARNYLLPQKLALEASGRNIKELDEKKRVLALKREKVRQQMLSLAEKLNQVRIVLRRKVSEEDKMYGSVTGADISAALEEKGFDLPRKSVLLDQPFKQLGEFSVSVRVDAQITAQVTLIIEKGE